MLQIGSLLDNKYRILSEIGHGGMSVVYLAINERANKTWAVKEVRKEGVSNLEAVMQGLIVETDMLKKFNHPNLPSIIDVIDTSESFIIVMDYIEGSSLNKLLKTEGAQPEEKVIKWGKQLCDVLGYLHRQNPPIIYRDMKPANVMLKPDGNVTLIDFGTAREFKNRAMVEDTTCLGTRGYAAPEQFGGRGQTDARTDIYCLGATLYHLLTGHSPAEPPYEIKPLSYWIPQYAGSGLEKLILKCTAQDPSERYQNCEELMYALNHYRDEDDIVQKQRKKKWKAFLACCIVAAVGIIGALGCRIGLSTESQKSYDAKIAQAENVNTRLNDSVDLYLQALEIDPVGDDVYESMLRKFEYDIADQGKFTGEASTQLNRILTAQRGVSTMEDNLSRRNKSEYAKVMYRIGLWYFFMKDNTDENKVQAWRGYFSKIKDEEYLQDGHLSSAEWNITNILSDIGELLGNLGNKKTATIGHEGEAENGSGQLGISYTNLFNKIYQMISRDLKTDLKYDYYIINVYQQSAYLIDTKFKDFRAEGVAIEGSGGMEDALGIIESGLKGLSIDSSSDYFEEYQAALSTLESAKNTVESAK